MSSATPFNPLLWLFQSSWDMPFDLAWVISCAFGHAERTYRPNSYIYQLIYLCCVSFGGGMTVSIICNIPFGWMAADDLVIYTCLCWFLCNFVRFFRKICTNIFTQHLLSVLNSVSWLRIIVWAMETYSGIKPGSITGPIVVGLVAGSTGGILITAEAAFWEYVKGRTDFTKLPSLSFIGLKISFITTLVYSLALHNIMERDVILIICGLYLCLWSLAATNGILVDPFLPFESAFVYITDHKIMGLKKPRSRGDKKGI
eukprot:TRINITY_DN10832_c0_g1_i1.p1 TRINITY_DN10832_c0_g1~~TRINITY_DN10832_c0_g1_i1.p1  ORF type:complete len:258 (+),score=10.05 TRINITY_DN10832_c0_g1_i1:28-801(+)